MRVAPFSDLAAVRAATVGTCARVRAHVSAPGPKPLLPPQRFQSRSSSDDGPPRGGDGGGPARSKRRPAARPRPRRGVRERALDPAHPTGAARREPALPDVFVRVRLGASTLRRDGCAAGAAAPGGVVAGRATTPRSLHTRTRRTGPCLPHWLRPFHSRLG